MLMGTQLLEYNCGLFCCWLITWDMKTKLGVFLNEWTVGEEECQSIIQTEMSLNYGYICI